MKKIILMGNSREINITSLEEVDNVNDIIKELIIPAFQASGFDPESIKDGLLSYINYTSVCDIEDCNNDNTIKLCNTCFDEMVYRPEEHKKEIHLLKTELDITKISLKSAEAVLMEIEAKNHGNNECEDEEEVEPEQEEIPFNQNRVPDSNVWTTGNQSTVQDGWTVPPADDKPVEPEQEEIPTPEPVVDETQTTEREKAIVELEVVEEQARQGKYDYRKYEGKRLTCDNIKNTYPDVDCSDRCSKCPVGIHSMETSLTFGIFCCEGCSTHFDEPFPKGFCPNCGIHQNKDNTSKNEFCGIHWDVNRKNDGYEADEDENWTDDDEEENDDCPF